MKIILVEKPHSFFFSLLLKLIKIQSKKNKKTFNHEKPEKKQISLSYLTWFEKHDAQRITLGDFRNEVLNFLVEKKN